jgi:hypothetical protein
MPRVASTMFILLLLTGTLGARAIAAPAKPAPGSVKAVLELNQQFYYLGEAMNVRVTIANNGPAEISNPVKAPILGSFAVLDASGTRLEAQGKPDSQEPSRPSKLASKAFYDSHCAGPLTASNRTRSSSP